MNEKLKICRFSAVFLFSMLIFSCTSVRGNGDATPGAREYSVELSAEIDGAVSEAIVIDGTAQTIREQSVELVRGLEIAQGDGSGLADELRDSADELAEIIRGLESSDDLDGAFDELLAEIRKRPIN